MKLIWKTNVAHCYPMSQAMYSNISLLFCFYEKKPEKKIKEIICHLIFHPAYILYPTHTVNMFLLLHIRLHSEEKWDDLFCLPVFGSGCFTKLGIVSFPVLESGWAFMKNHF